MSAPPHESVSDMAMLPHEYRVMFEIEQDYWWYQGLRALIGDLLDRYAAPDNSTRILDAGCGTGRNLELFLERGSAVGVDIATDAIEFCQRRGIPHDRALVASLLELPFRNQAFDLAFSFDVICNIQNDVASLSELRRVIAPGGRLVTQLPAYRFLWSAHDVAVGHKHRYTAEDLRAKLEQAGWTVQTITYLNMALFPFIALTRLARRGQIHNGQANSDLTPLAPLVNKTLARLFTTEMRFAARRRLPYGISLLAVAKN